MFSPKFLKSSTNSLRVVLQTSMLARPMSAQPSVNEAREALEHIEEAEKVKSAEYLSIDKKRQTPPKLDRERDLNLTYSIVGPEKLSVANNLLYATYHPDEPITKHLGLYKGLNSIPDADRLVQQILPKHLSLFAYDSTGEVVGVCVNNNCLRSEFLDDLDHGLEEVMDPSYKPMLAIHIALRKKNLHIYDEMRTEKFFSIRMVGVDPKTRGMGVATDLIRRSILLAGCLGFSGIKTEATGKFSQKAFSTIGMLQTNSIQYADYEFEGKKVFEGMDNKHTELAFMKKKFFQSCLKHIM